MATHTLVDGSQVTDEQLEADGDVLITMIKVKDECNIFSSSANNASYIGIYHPDGNYLNAMGGLTYGANGYLYACTTKGWLQIPDASNVDISYARMNKEAYDAVVKDNKLNEENKASGANTVDDRDKSRGNPDSEGIEYALSNTYDVNDSMTEDDISVTAKSIGDLSLKDATAFLRDPKGVFGMPYQYLESNDYPIEGSTFGSMYTEKIIQHLPVLLLSPGRPNFMSDYSSGTAKGMLTRMLDGSGADMPSLEAILGEETGKFYSFDYKYIEYFNYVNPICHLMAQYLRIASEDSPTAKGILGASLGDYDWKKYASESFKTYYSAADTVAFYIDSETQISESFGNSTTESQLASGINSLSSMSREIQFLIGGSSGLQFEKLKQENATEFSNEINSFVKKYSSMFTKKFQANLSQGILNVASGGKIIFPEIWADSSFSRSYSCTIKLRTPDCDKLSIYYNILVPIAHLLGLMIPLQNGVNGIMSPFIVRAHYKGFFTTDMAIITDMSISKGDKCKWTMDGLPTEVDVTINIKDLYQTLSLSNETNPKDFARNNQELDYIANMCGLNINKPDAIRSITLFYYRYLNFVKSSVTNVAWSINKSVVGLLKGIYSKP